MICNFIYHSHFNLILFLCVNHKWKLWDFKSRSVQRILKHKLYWNDFEICYWDGIISSCLIVDIPLASLLFSSFLFFLIFLLLHIFCISSLLPPSAHTSTFLSLGSLIVCWPLIKRKLTPSVFLLYQACVLLFFLKLLVILCEYLKFIKPSDLLIFCAETSKTNHFINFIICKPSPVCSANRRRV